MSTARLRKTFRYPTDDEDDELADVSDVMDEQEQESLILRLAEQNRQRNDQFRHLLLALPGIATIPYLLETFRSPTSLANLLSILALSSLSATAILIYRLPPTQTGIAMLDSWSHSHSHSQGPSSPPPSSSLLDREKYEYDDDDDADGPSGGNSGGFPLSTLNRNTSNRQKRRSRHHRPGLLATGIPSFFSPQQRSPLETFLPYLNAFLCVVVAIVGMLNHRAATTTATRTTGGGGLAGLGNLSGVVYAVTIMAKVFMAGVDPERELGGLRYEYKGA
ncbi:hypothetical protein B0H63DRAFT_469021 [Podospora didyma]|uniref:Uncharacterized protein n=1 Tax=Podospora didyma TaxID=330526 RepID=A0AAE0NSV9_9PEZI|nr:hypothetical protein B0H63DRAFT_469021 [Podospora didyma]